MNQQDYMAGGSDILSVVFSGIQTESVYKYICLGLTILSIIFGIVLKVISLMKEAKARKAEGQEMGVEDLQKHIKELEAENVKLQTSLNQVNTIVGRVNLQSDKKGA